MEEFDCFLRGSVVFDSTVEVKLVDELFEVDEILCFFFNEYNQFALLDEFCVGCHSLVGSHAELHFCVRLEFQLPAIKLLEILFFFSH